LPSDGRIDGQTSRKEDQRTMHTYQISIGCYIDGANQNQTEADARVVRLSEGFGRTLDREMENFCRRVELDVPTENDLEFSNEMSEEAESWLNDNAALPYCFWGWDNGDFGLWPNMDEIAELPHLENYPDELPGEDFAVVSDHGNIEVYDADGKSIFGMV
jgi:hypothetical protein